MNVAEAVALMTEAQYAQIRSLLPGLVLRDRLRAAGLDDGLRWVLPSDMLPGGGTLYGLPVVHADVPEPVGSSRVDLQACKLEYSIVSPK